MADPVSRGESMPTDISSDWIWDFCRSDPGIEEWKKRNKALVKMFAGFIPKLKYNKECSIFSGVIPCAEFMERMYTYLPSREVKGLKDVESIYDYLHRRIGRYNIFTKNNEFVNVQPIVIGAEINEEGFVTSFYVMVHSSLVSPLKNWIGAEEACISSMII